MSTSRIMYMEYKSGEEALIGIARIGKVSFSKTRKSVHYNGKIFVRISGFKENYMDENSGEYYWISGCKKNGEDRNYGERLPIFIDDDIREEYWTTIRNQPENKHLNRIH